MYSGTTVHLICRPIIALYAGRVHLDCMFSCIYPSVYNTGPMKREDMFNIFLYNNTHPKVKWAHGCQMWISEHIPELVLLICFCSPSPRVQRVTQHYYSLLPTTEYGNSSMVILRPCSDLVLTSHIWGTRQKVVRVRRAQHWPPHADLTISKSVKSYYIGHTQCFAPPSLSLMCLFACRAWRWDAITSGHSRRIPIPRVNCKGRT